MTDQAQALVREIVAEAERRLFDESMARIKRCLGTLSEAEIWRRPNAETVSVGNLVLHLCGNVRQWIISGLGGAPDVRDRPREFSEKGPIPTDALIEQLESTVEEALEEVHNLSVDDFLGKHTIQGFSEVGIAALIHVIEHFSYHTGQITLATKMMKAIDMKYYPGIE